MESGNNPNSESRRSSQNFIEKNRERAGSFSRRYLTDEERQVRSRGNTQSPAPPGTRGILPGETNFIERNKQYAKDVPLRSAIRTSTTSSSDRKTQFAAVQDGSHEEGKVQRTPTPYVKVSQPSQRSVRLTAGDVVGIAEEPSSQEQVAEEIPPTDPAADTVPPTSPLPTTESAQPNNDGTTDQPAEPSRDDEEFYTPPTGESPVKPVGLPNPFTSANIPLQESCINPIAVTMTNQLETNDDRSEEQVAADVQAVTEKMMSQSLAEAPTGTTEDGTKENTKPSADHEEMKALMNEHTVAKEQSN